MPASRAQVSLTRRIYLLGEGRHYASNFHDITTGNNTNGVSPTNFFAIPGYDLCTGWGTPAGSNLLNSLTTPLDVLQIAPETAFTATGPAGGPFSPAAQNYSLTNFGVSSLNWTLVSTSLWLNASPASGTLTPGGPATAVTFSLNVAATNLPAGTYSATVWFTNLTSHLAQSRQVILNTLAPPVVTAQPQNQTVLEGMTATFTVGVANSAGLSFQWQQDNGMYLAPVTDGGNVSGSATGTLTISNVSPANVGAYSVIASNVSGVVTSAVAYLAIVPWRPVITAQPTSQTVLPGQTVTLTVTAVGSQPLFYLWQQNGTNLADGGNLFGSASSSLTLHNVSAANAGSYSVTVGNGDGLVASADAVLTVLSPTAPGTTLTTLWSFSGGSDGGNPNGLVLGTHGNLYGTTQNGGSNSLGSIFRVAPNGVLAGLYSFTGGSDGANPFAGLAQGPDGNFYGAAWAGGTNGFGAIFQVASNGALIPLYSFTGGNDGASPHAVLTLGNDGSFYGTAYYGGTANAGTIFRITPGGAFSALYSFSGQSDGAYPFAGLVQGAGGNFYGTTYKGGASGNGTVFKITANGILTTLVAFNSANGAYPYGGLVQGDDGNFYGTTSSGGSCSSGTVFKMTPAGALTTLYSFSFGSDGAYPYAGLAPDSGGNFFGATAYGGAYGGGTVFIIAPDGTLATLVQFDGYNGASPQAPLVVGADGSFYGTTQTGGPGGRASIFRLALSAPQILSQPLSQTVFTGSNVVFHVAAFGSAPMSYQWRVNGTDLAEAGNLSGTAASTLTLSNVTLADAGTYLVFITNAWGSISSAGVALVVTSSPPIIVQQPSNQTVAPGGTATFTVVAAGSLPLSYQWQENGTNLADGPNISGSTATTLALANLLESANGTVSVVVSNAISSVISTGAVLAVVPASAPGTRLATLHAFTGSAEGASPNGLVQGADGNLYGTTTFGGDSGLGTVFRMAPDGTLTTLVSFAGTNGALPRAALAQGGNGNLYGTTSANGLYGWGTVFKLTPGGALTTLYSFTGSNDGGFSTAALIQGADGSFYGTTATNSPGGHGTVFQVTPDGALANLYSFTGGADGGSPADALLQGADGAFYGVTPTGGTHGTGNVFKVTAGGVFTNVYSFSGSDGFYPVGALVQGADGSFYGATKFNTLSGYVFNGAIVRISTNGALTYLYQLNAYDGHYPFAGLIHCADGYFYGTTFSGAGFNTNGTIFRINTAITNNALTTLVNLDGFDGGAHPESALVLGADGSLYGTTTAGGPGGQGTVFRLSLAPQITTPPAGQVAFVGANVTFSVSVFGSSPFTWQWLRNGTNLTDGPNLSGSASRTLTLSNITAAAAGTYSVIVSNALGSVTSSGALLTVIPAPVFQTVRQTNGALALTWSAAVGQKYQLQYKPDLTAAGWTNLGNWFLATNALMSASDLIGSNPQRFYRVVLLP